MPRTVEEIVARIEAAGRAGFRGRLLARGQARNLLWKEGTVPDDSPPFARAPLLTSDLLGYGLALLQLGLELRTQNPGHPSSIDAFGRSAEAIEAVIRNGDPTFNERGFYTILAAAAYHLGHFSARAFSLLPSRTEEANISPAERSLSQLMRRDLKGLRQALLEMTDGQGFDATLTAKLKALDRKVHDDTLVYHVLDALYHQALAQFDYALEGGDYASLVESLKTLDEGITMSSELRSVPFWWIFSVTRHLLDDLWGQSFHVRLPLVPPGSSGADRWQTLRMLFIAKLHCLSRAEVDLWPSQLDAAIRAIDISDDLIAALPTSAGKTRIAEICILRTLSTSKRVVFVTPLRALSAQTEKSLRQTFGALGFSISSLYGSSGTTGDDADSLANRDIVVSTPEKLDFALRNNPEILDDVGLIVLDEAHTIGEGEREVRYEVLVQRLLRRPDSDSRRLVCLSAILPQGEQLNDFVAWIRQDQEGSALTINWRPTRQRFGEVAWSSVTRSAKLQFAVEGAQGEDAPYINSFVASVDPLPPQRTPLPRNRPDLSLMVAWRLIEEGKTVLMYCPERRSVMPLASRVLDLVNRGYFPSQLVVDESLIVDALNIGAEWLGSEHEAVKCLRIGVAVHHGQLPRPFLRAVEKLLKEQLIKVTISSPTLAQGLNLSATTVLFTGLKRFGKTIPGEEFANVAGRAGRAFVDVEGQVLCVAWERKHLREWDELVRAQRNRNLKSGLLQLILGFCQRLATHKECTLETALEYITGSVNPWVPPQLADLTTVNKRKAQAEFEHRWRKDLASIDSALLSLVQHDVSTDDLAATLDSALNSSLWQRSMLHERASTQQMALAVLRGRGLHIWGNSTAVQRKGYFFAGLGFETGQLIDQNSQQLWHSLFQADLAFATNQPETGIQFTIEFAKIAFIIPPFTPDFLPADWEAILKTWVMGRSLTDLAGGMEEDVLEFVEAGLVYRLVWAMEAVRVRRNAEVDNPPTAEPGLAAVALETGTYQYCASLLIQSGLASRIAALKAVSDCPATFTDLQTMRAWLHSERVRAFTTAENWPTPETASLWREFLELQKSSRTARWSDHGPTPLVVNWHGAAPPTGSKVRLLYDNTSQSMVVYSVKLEPLGEVPFEWDHEPVGLIIAEVTAAPNTLSVRYLGPRDFWSDDGL